MYLSKVINLGVYEYGDKEQLLRAKPFFEEDIRNNELGKEFTLILKLIGINDKVSLQLINFSIRKIDFAACHCARFLGGFIGIDWS